MSLNQQEVEQPAPRILPGELFRRLRLLAAMVDALAEIPATTDRHARLRSALNSLSQEADIINQSLQGI